MDLEVLSHVVDKKLDAGTSRWLSQPAPKPQRAISKMPNVAHRSGMCENTNQPAKVANAMLLYKKGLTLEAGARENATISK
jgi:hypothetical protein